MNKRNILNILFFLFFISVNAQSITPSINFKIIRPGVLSRIDSEENYYIIENEGKTASLLYNNVLSAISTLYKNPEKVISKVENVSVNVTASAEVTAIYGDYAFECRFDYTLHFLFKDGKIRVNAPSFDSDNIFHFNELYGRWQKVAPHFSIQHFSGEKDDVAQSFENYLNSIVVEIIRKSATIDNW